MVDDRMGQLNLPSGFGSTPTMRRDGGAGERGGSFSVNTLPRGHLPNAVPRPTQRRLKRAETGAETVACLLFTEPWLGGKNNIWC